MKDDITKMLGMSDFKNKIYHYDLTEEIFQWRCRIRSLEFLRNPQDEKAITNTNGEQMDYDLVNFSFHAKENMNSYNSDYKNGHEFGKGRKLQPIFVLQADREKCFDIANKTNATIEKEILTALEEIDMTLEGEILMEQWQKKVKKGTKVEYVTFYREVLQAVDEATSNEDHDLDEDSQGEGRDPSMRLKIEKLKCGCNLVIHLKTGGGECAKTKTDLKRQDNYKCVIDGIELNEPLHQDSNTIKQRSNAWHQLRNGSRVRGSSKFRALGLDTLKKQQNHYDNVYMGVEQLISDHLSSLFRECQLCSDATDYYLDFEQYIERLVNIIKSHSSENYENINPMQIIELQKNQNGTNKQLSKIEKFNYLKSKLSGDAKHVISGLSLSNGILKDIQFIWIFFKRKNATLFSFVTDEYAVINPSNTIMYEMPLFNEDSIPVHVTCTTPDNTSTSSGTQFPAPHDLFSSVEGGLDGSCDLFLDFKAAAM
ncbi:unnamed protein product [Mytilus edulis]|uniref:Uncharacterized protein n=1 Tax=Mytilus edulis TaxID=6550 RepID=A0A8S3QJS0_MYTED|nr:unnamed protein product [Mytilus edulis]